MHLGPVAFQSVPRLSLSLATVPEDLSPPLRPHDCTSLNQAHALVHPKAVNVWQGHSLRPAAPRLLSVIVSKLTRTLQGRPYYPHFADRKQMLREVGNLPRATQGAELSMGAGEGE